MINTVNRTTTPVPSGVAGPNPARGDEMGKDAFLQLLVTQLRNQDPMSPMDGQAMAAQLAQFSGLEQMMGMSQRMDEVAASNTQLGHIMNTSLANSMVGRSVLAPGDAAHVSDDGSMVAHMDIGGTGGATSVVVHDAAGKEVATKQIGDLVAGRHDIPLTFDDLPAGDYTYEVTVAGADGANAPVVTYSEARIEGVQFGADGLMLMSGKKAIPMSDVVMILA